MSCPGGKTHDCVCTGILKESDTFFGKFDTDEDFILINDILLLEKLYTYSKKCQSSPSTIHGLIAWIKRIDSQGLSFKLPEIKISAQSIIKSGKTT